MIKLFLINSVLVATAVLVHYEMLYRLSRLIPRLSFLKPRLRILVAVFGALIAHVMEVWLFAFAYFYMIQDKVFGELRGGPPGVFSGSLMDCSYFSFTTYTSLGFGDIEPIGDVRFLAGLESLAGLVLISWTASFMFIEMQRLWVPQIEE